MGQQCSNILLFKCIMIHLTNCTHHLLTIDENNPDIKRNMTAIKKTTTKTISTKWYKEKKGYTSEGWIKQLASIAGTEHWSKQKQRQVAQLIERCIHPHLPHKLVDGAAVISQEEFRGKFARHESDYLKDFIFTSTNKYCYEQGIAKDYRLNHDFCLQLHQMFETYQPDRSKILRADSGKIVKRLYPTRRKHQNIASEGTLHNVPAMCPINLYSLAHANLAITEWINHFQNGVSAIPKVLNIEVQNKIIEYSEGVKSDREAIELTLAYLQRSQFEICYIMALANNGIKFSHIPQTFCESDAGRWYADGLSLQSCCSLTRRAALHGYWQLDIEACHHSVLLNYAKNTGVLTPQLNSYVSDRTSYRQALAEATGISVASIKKALIARIYGAQLTKFSAIEAILGAKRELLITNRKFQLLDDDITRVIKLMVDRSERVFGRVKNDKGKLHKKKYKNNAEPEERHEASHLVQGLESMCLEAALKVHKSAVLPLHDGWVCTEKESAELAKKSILEATGMSMGVEVEQYKLSGIEIEDSTPIPLERAS